MNEAHTVQTTDHAEIIPTAKDGFFVKIALNDAARERIHGPFDFKGEAEAFAMRKLAAAEEMRPSM